MKTFFKIIIFNCKFLCSKIFSLNRLHSLSVKTLLSRCRWSSEIVVLGKSRMSLGTIECASNTRLAAVAGGKLMIDDHCYFNRNCTIISRNNIQIGKTCAFGPNVCVYDHDHAFGKEGQTGKFKLGKVIIGDNCWIGTGVIILRDTIIGKNSIIAAGCIVSGTIPENSLVTMERALKIRPLHD